MPAQDTRQLTKGRKKYRHLLIFLSSYRKKVCFTDMGVHSDHSICVKCVLKVLAFYIFWKAYTDQNRQKPVTPSQVCIRRSLL